jgi:hypothetical protein
MTDLVERLRSESRHAACHSHRLLISEAADEIERLHSNLQKMQSAQGSSQDRPHDQSADAGPNSPRSLTYLWPEPQTVTVPAMQTQPFSRNERWAEAVRAAMKAHTDDGSRIDPVWAVLLALPKAAEALAEREGYGVPSRRNHASQANGMTPSSGSHIPPNLNMGSEHDSNRFECEP